MHTDISYGRQETCVGSYVYETDDRHQYGKLKNLPPVRNPAT